jgi:hypothetical protein
MYNSNYTKEMNSKEEIFQLEIKSKKFHDDIREEVFISKEVYKTQFLLFIDCLNNRNFKFFLTNANVTSRSLNTSWSIFIEQLVNTFVKWYRKSSIIK